MFIRSHRCLAGVLLPPSLTIQRWPGGSLRLSWPASAPGYTLEVSFQLPGPWEDAGWGGMVPAPEGNEQVVYVTRWDGALFFRLMKP